MLYKHIVVAVDNDPHSEKVCSKAFQIADCCDANMTLIHVAPVAPIAIAPGVMGAAAVPPAETEQEQHQRLSDAEDELKSIIERVRGSSPSE